MALDLKVVLWAVCTIEAKIYQEKLPHILCSTDLAERSGSRQSGTRLRGNARHVHTRRRMKHRRRRGSSDRRPSSHPRRRTLRSRLPIRPVHPEEAQARCRSLQLSDCGIRYSWSSWLVASPNVSHQARETGGKFAHARFDAWLGIGCMKWSGAARMVGPHKYDSTKLDRSHEQLPHQAKE